MNILPEKFLGKKVVLLGGGGFIGHNLALKLAELGCDVHIIDSLQVNNLGSFSADSQNIKNKEYVNIINERLSLLRANDISLHVVDCRDYQALSSVISNIEPHAFIQLAAIAHANRSNKDPFSTFDHSFRTLENALDIARNFDSHFVYFSSSMVYGDFDGETVKEDRVCEPLGIYGALKFGGEKLVLAYNQVFGLSYTIIRPSALYGERCVSRRVGQAFIENALADKPLTINGTGEDRLDFTYIGDLVQGVLRVLCFDSAKNETFNLTFGNGRSINELAGIVKANFPNIVIEYHERDALMPERGSLSIEKAKKLLGYTPMFPIEKGFQNYIDWYKSR